MKRVIGCLITLSVSAVAIGGGIATASSSKPPGTERSIIALNAKALTVTFPLYEGVTATGKPTYYIVTDASTAALAKKYGVNTATKLAKALGTKARCRQCTSALTASSSPAL